MKNLEKVPVKQFQKFLQEKLERDFEGNKQAMAEAVGMSTSRLSQFLNGTKRARGSDLLLKEVSIHVVDRAAVNLDSHLIEIAPQLYSN